ncbi:MAG TPA: hypothetical protein DCZ95_16485 [Verrucomicrobia bacterium]|nr:MAG: hypothetical protein A2X46_15675 [Lentisphaerae bacterium GWF2_57_35]HBA85680.1 hypothetical protein [Verrucomicrobiota bacterium]
MKNISTHKYGLWISALLLGVSVLPGFGAVGDYTNLHSFIGGANDGDWPMAGPIESGGRLYGMTQLGGASNFGVIYAMDLDGANYTHLHSFSGADGKYPLGALTISGANLYGLVPRGGTNDSGVLFRLGANGAAFTVLHLFDAADENNGAMPWAGLLESGGIFYGTTCFGGFTNRGVVFAIQADGSGYTNLHRFVGGAGDGKYPKGDLLLEGGWLYGTASGGGASNAGVIFAMLPDGTHYTNLYEFTGASSDGQNPAGRLAALDGYLYGLAAEGGRHSAGIAFALATNGGALQILWPFAGTAGEGAGPCGNLIRHDAKLYGLTRYGGGQSGGTLFSLGASFSNQLSWLTDGEPLGDPLWVGNAMYSTTLRGGVSNHGSIFRFEGNPSDGVMDVCKITWIDTGSMNTNAAGDQNWRRLYVRHTTTNGLPQAFIGHGLTPDADDATWTWTPITQYGDLGAEYEFTGTLSRASPGEYLVAAKFIQGLHVYYPPPTFNVPGDWHSPLDAVHRWSVTPLPAPSNAQARFVHTNAIDASYERDGVHWVSIFRKSGASPSFRAPVDGVTYYTGSRYADQGECVYLGSETPVHNTGLTVNTDYHYRFYTENHSFYSSGAVAWASTRSSGDDDGDTMFNEWETVYGLNPSDPSDFGLDPDADRAENWKEFVAGTDPTNGLSVFCLNQCFFDGFSILSWSSVSGKQYTIRRAANLLAGFDSNLAVHVSSTPPENTYTDRSAEASFLFYHIEVEPQ